nr:MAG TPA: hypothetical protein [Caudoviricetes sp.]
MFSYHKYGREPIGNSQYFLDHQLFKNKTEPS